MFRIRNTDGTEKRYNDRERISRLYISPAGAAFFFFHLVFKIIIITPSLSLAARHSRTSYTRQYRLETVIMIIKNFITTKRFLFFFIFLLPPPCRHLSVTSSIFVHMHNNRARNVRNTCVDPRTCLRAVSEAAHELPV